MRYFCGTSDTSDTSDKNYTRDTSDTANSSDASKVSVGFPNLRVILIESNKSNDTKQVRPMGYKTCHNLNSSLDSTVCAKDCDRQKKGKFFEECKVSISLSFLF